MKMLKPEKMLDGILIGTSIYFAGALKDRLLAYHENTWTIIMLFAVVLCWLKVEDYCATEKKRILAQNGFIDMPHDVMFEVIYVISQTIGFLAIQFVIATIDGLILEQHLFMQAAVMPTLMLLFCILLVSVTKKIQAKYTT